MSLYSSSIWISSTSSSGFRSITLPFSCTMGFSFCGCFLGDAHTHFGAFFLSFSVFGPSLVNVGHALGDLGDLGISSSTSMLTTFWEAPSTVIATFGAILSCAISFPVITISAITDMIVENNSYISFGSFSNSELTIKASKYSHFIRT